MANVKEAPTNLYVVSNKYGTIESKLAVNLGEDSHLIEKEYKIENLPEEVVDVCREIESLAGRALLVGGSVRDCIISQVHKELKLKPKDFDLEVYGMSFEDLQRFLETKFGSDRVDTVGRAFGIIKVKIDGWDEPLDFSIPRVDSNSGEGHKGFTVAGRPGMTIREAAARRDITINSMSYDPLTGVVYDPFNGIEDIKAKIIRITDPKAFQEDPLRVIRIMQFMARFEFGMDPNDSTTEDLCREMVQRGDVSLKSTATADTESQPRSKSNKFVPGEIEEKPEDRSGFMVVQDGKEQYLKPEKRSEKGLPRERITEEMYKLLLKGRRPSYGLEFARRIGLMKELWPDIDAMYGVKQHKEWHPEEDLWEHALQNADAMAEITDRELRSGKIPTEDMLQKLDEQVEMFVFEKKKQILFELQKTQITSVEGEDALSEIYLEARSIAEGVAKKFIDNAMTEARRQADGMAGRAYERGDKKIPFADLSDKFYHDIVVSYKKKWDIEVKTLRIGNEDKEFRRLVQEKIARLMEEGRIPSEVMVSMENLAEEMAKDLAVDEKKRRLANLRNDIKITLVWTAFCHDLGKVTASVKGEDGIIRSPGHEQQGVEPMRRVLSVFDKTRFSPEMRARMLPLIAEHLKPGEIYRDIHGRRNDEDISENSEENETDQEVEIEKEGEVSVKKQKELKRRLNRLQHRLMHGDSDRSLKGGKKTIFYADGGGANLYLLGLVAEADNRGRSDKGRFSTREEAKLSLEWQSWWNEKIEEMNFNKPEPKILNGEDILVRVEQKHGGPWVGVIIKCVDNDILDGMVKKDKEDALQAAFDYYQRLVIYVNAQYEMLPVKRQNEKERSSIWAGLLKGDPREVLKV